MFNRTIQLDVVKKNKQPEPTPEELQASMEELFDITSKLLPAAGKYVMKMVAGYLVLDTARKIAIGRYGK